MCNCSATVRAGWGYRGSKIVRDGIIAMLVWRLWNWIEFGHVTCLISYYRVYSCLLFILYHSHSSHVTCTKLIWCMTSTMDLKYNCPQLSPYHHKAIKRNNRGDNDHVSCHRAMRIIRVIAGSWEVINVINNHHFLPHPPLDHCHLCHVQGHPFAVPPLQE